MAHQTRKKARGVVLASVKAGKLRAYIHAWGIQELAARMGVSVPTAASAAAEAELNRSSHTCAVQFCESMPDAPPALDEVAA